MIELIESKLIPMITNLSQASPRKVIFKVTEEKTVSKFVLIFES